MADNTENIYSIDFDPDKFIAGIDEALASLKKFDSTNEKFADALSLLTKNVNSVSFTKPVTEINNLKKAVEQFNTQGKKINMDEFNKAFDEFSKDAPRIEEFLKDIRKEMELLDKQSQDFKDLEQFVKQVETAMQGLKEEAQDTETQGFVPLRKRLKEVKVAMQEMEAQGQDNTEAFQKMEIEAAQLTDQLGDQAEKIRVLASDTFAMDATVDTLQNVAAGWQVIEGVMALAGQDNEELQKSMQRLMAVMNIANGLQQINAFLTGQSAGKVALLNIATKAQAMAQGLVATATGAATAATKAWGTALAATGIGAIVVAVGFLVNALMDYIDTSDEAAAATESLNSELEKQNILLELDINAAKRRNDVYIASLKARGATEKEIQAATRKATIEELNLLKTDMDNKKKLSDQAMSQKFTEKGTIKKYQDEALKAEEKYNDAVAAFRISDYNSQADALKKRNDAQKKADEDLLKLNEEYLKKLAEQRNKLQTVKEADQPANAQAIVDRYNRELAIEVSENSKKFKKLGAEKVNTLNAVTKQTSELQAKIEIEGFNAQQNEVRSELLKTISDTQNEIANERIQLIDNEYERVNAEIAQQEKQRKETIAQSLTDAEKDLKEKVKAGLPQAEATAQLTKLTQLAQEQVALVEKDSYEKRLANNRAFLDKMLQQAKDYNELALSEDEKNISERILNESQLLAKGEISYQQYLDRKKKIEKDGAKSILDTKIQNYDAELKALEDKYRAAEEIDKVGIQTQINNIQKAKNEALTQKNTIDKELSGTDSLIGKLLGTDDQAEVDKFKDAAQKAINATIDLIRQRAQAEVDAADAAIAAQQKQVDAATKIAEEGNAEYLQQEEERLKELEAKREEAARRQLEIDAAIQASQILVAVAGAAAQIAKGGTVGVITGIASIIAAVATGAQLLNSLQSQRPKFFDGTDYVSRGTNPVGRDTVPAMLHEGEAVISTDKNKMYAPTIKAIRRGLVPADAVNKFVTDYNSGLNYDGIAKAVEVKVSNDRNYAIFGEMASRLSRLENVMERTAQSIAKLKVNVSMDSEGFAASIQNHINLHEKIKNA